MPQRAAVVCISAIAALTASFSASRSSWIWLISVW
eukprot:CAMPEP_0206171370 /NCGR_PEP_ID=MMETSP1474-20131121/42065_1 /ASSEMBLY_ACC=CAM_ASM_001110 /TAXON_ID=97495 /ORGANISM="Imantonia sp., Strain RCC918" /LENGTH=34 /DNA_ID= /DNA_START= /DNA_END= /DNA_ORIENTATION=